MIIWTKVRTTEYTIQGSVIKLLRLSVLFFFTNKNQGFRFIVAPTHHPNIGAPPQKVTESKTK
jgi:hypothetical protein